MIWDHKIEKNRKTVFKQTSRTLCSNNSYRCFWPIGIFVVKNGKTRLKIVISSVLIAHNHNTEFMIVLINFKVRSREKKIKKTTNH